jgi:hypothetical protein
MTHTDLCKKIGYPLAVVVVVLECDNLFDVAPFLPLALVALVYCCGVCWWHAPMGLPIRLKRYFESRRVQRSRENR